MHRALLAFIILVTLVIFPDRSWLCQPVNAPVPVVANPCDHVVSPQPATSAVGIGVFSLLAPLLIAANLNMRVFSLAYSPLLTPEELPRPQIDHPPRSHPSNFPTKV